MTTLLTRLSIATLLLGAAPAAMVAQDSLPGHPATVPTAAEATAPETHQQAESGQIDIQHHIGNTPSIELPYWKPPFSKTIPLPQGWVIHIGNFALDVSPTKHSVFLVLAAVLVALTFILSGRSVARAEAQGRPPRGFAGAMEAMALWIRQEVVLPNVGPHGEGYAPYLLTVFFFVLACNLLGLVPFGATATGNIAVTAALAFISFLVIEISGMRSLGFKGYLQTIFFVPHGVPTVMKPVLLVIMTPIEIIGKFAKPFALAVRLFANMTAGHVLVLALIGLTFLFRSWAVGIGAATLATGIMLLELFVAFLQAFVFTLLTAVFIGLMRQEH